MSIYCSTGGIDAFKYEGSGRMPSRHDERFSIDLAYPAAHIPTRLEAKRGVDYVEGREGAGWVHPWLRFGMMGAGCSFVLDEAGARDLRDFLNEWLSSPKLKRVG